jgi:hypothetical protein
MIRFDLAASEYFPQLQLEVLVGAPASCFYLSDAISPRSNHGFPLLNREQSNSISIVKPPVGWVNLFSISSCNNRRLCIRRPPQHLVESAAKRVGACGCDRQVAITSLWQSTWCERWRGCEHSKNSPGIKNRPKVWELRQHARNARKRSCHRRDLAESRWMWQHQLSNKRNQPIGPPDGRSVFSPYSASRHFTILSISSMLSTADC